MAKINILLLLTFLLNACSGNIKQEEEVNKIDNLITTGKVNSVSKKNPGATQEKKTVYFEQKFGNYANQTSSYKLEFEGNNIRITYIYADNEPLIETAVFKNGKIISGDCSNCYELRSDGLCVNNPETGEPDCYNYIASKSTTSIDNLLNKKDVNIDENYEQVDNYVTLREAQLTLIDGSKKKLNLYLGKPDYIEMLPYGVGAVAVFVNRVKDNGQIKDLTVGFENGTITSVQAIITKYHRN